MIAMRAMRDNEKAAVIVARQHTSERQPREACRGPAAGSATDTPSVPAPPPPYTGEGQGGGMHKGSRVRSTPSPTLPRKRERERTEFAALICSNIAISRAPLHTPNHVP